MKVEYSDGIITKEANMILNQDMRFRDVARVLRIPLSTVNAHINIRLKRFDPDTYQKVHERVQTHRHKQWERVTSGD